MDIDELPQYIRITELVAARTVHGEPFAECHFGIQEDVSAPTTGSGEK